MSDAGPLGLVLPLNQLKISCFYLPQNGIDFILNESIYKYRKQKSV